MTRPLGVERDDANAERVEQRSLLGPRGVQRGCKLELAGYVLESDEANRTALDVQSPRPSPDAARLAHPQLEGKLDRLGSGLGLPKHGLDRLLAVESEEVLEGNPRK